MRCGCAQRCQGSTPGTWSHQDLACLTVHPAQLKSIFSVALLGKLRHGATQEPRTTLPPLAPAAPSNLAGTRRFPGPLHRDQHQDAAHHPHPNPWWNILGGEGGCGWAPGVPPHRQPRHTFHQLQPCPNPTRLPGPRAHFPGHGTGSEPTAAACWLGGGPWPKTLPPLVFSCKSLRRLSAAPGLLGRASP